MGQATLPHGVCGANEATEAERAIRTQTARSYADRADDRAHGTAGEGV